MLKNKLQILAGTLCLVLLFMVGAITENVNATVATKTTAWGIPLSPCAWCGSTQIVQVHHIYPQHLWPERAHDTNNMLCLCSRCHLVLGHRGNWTNAVTNLVKMIEEGKK